MGSNNSKVKKKNKFKKLKKFRKFKKINRTKLSAPELCKEANFVRTLSGIQDIYNYRLCDQQIYSRSYTHDHDIPKIMKFTQVRERYLGYLLTVIKYNCAFYGSPVAEDVLESLSRKLEQNALVSSLQIDVYECFLNKIINDIEKCTKERRIHNEVKKLLPGSEEVVLCDKFNAKSPEPEKSLERSKEPVVCDEFNANSPESHNSLRTITLSDSSDNNLNENEIIFENQSVFNSEVIDQCPPHSQPYFEPHTVPQDSDELSSLSDTRTNDDYDIASNDHLNFGRKEPEGTIRAIHSYDPAPHYNPNFTRKESEGIVRANNYDPASIVNSNFERNESEGGIIRANDCNPISIVNSNFARKECEGTFGTNDNYDSGSHYSSNYTRKEPEEIIRTNDYDPASIVNANFTRKEPEGTNHDHDPASIVNSNFGRNESEGIIRASDPASHHSSNLIRKEPEGIIRANDYYIGSIVDWNFGRQESEGIMRANYYDPASLCNPNFTRREPEGTIIANDDYNPASTVYSNFERNEFEGGIIRANGCDPISIVNSNFGRKEPEGTIRANHYDPASIANANFAGKEPEGPIRANNYDPASQNLNFARKEPEGTSHDHDPASIVNSNFGRNESEGIIRANDYYIGSIVDWNFGRQESEGIMRANDYDPASLYNPNLKRTEPEGIIRANDEYHPASNNYLSPTSKEPEALPSNEIEILQASPSISEIYSPSQNEYGYGNQNGDLSSIPLSSEKFVNNVMLNSFIECSKVIEKCMEQIFTLDDISDEYLEKAKAHIIQLLAVENFQDEAEPARNEKRNQDEMEYETGLESERERNLAKRLDKMRPFFNIDETPTKSRISTKSKHRKPSLNKETEHLRCLTAWKNEKIIQQYKVTILTSKLSYEKRGEMGKLFIELFGQDSDEEHEFEYGSTNQFKTSCIERISSWVVKHLTPFYDERRIIGRNVFKSLGRRISRKIIDKIQYPDERTVKYFVHKFFPPHKRYGLRFKRHL